MKVQIGIFECTGIMGQDLVHPYIQSTTVLCDNANLQSKGDLLPEAIFTGCQHKVTMATVLIGYKVVRSLMLIHTTIVKL